MNLSGLFSGNVSSIRFIIYFLPPIIYLHKQLSQECLSAKHSVSVKAIIAFIL